MIKNYLEDNRIKSPTNKTRWYYSVIKSILTNEKYIGDVYSQKTFKMDMLDKKRMINNSNIDSYYVINHHEPIIDKTIFNLAQIKIIKKEYDRNVNTINCLDIILSEDEYEAIKSYNILQLNNDNKKIIINKIIDHLNRK